MSMRWAWQVVGVVILFAHGVAWADSVVPPGAGEQAKLAQLRRRLEVARVEAEAALGAARTMKAELARCDSGIQNDEKAVAKVTAMVQSARMKVRRALSKERKSGALAANTAAQAKRAKATAASYKRNVEASKQKLIVGMAGIKRDIAIVNDLKRKRDEAAAVANKMKKLKGDKFKLQEAEVVPGVLDRALEKAKKKLPAKQQAVRDAAASYEQAKQVYAMSRHVAARDQRTAKKELTVAKQAREYVTMEKDNARNIETDAAAKQERLMVKKQAQIHLERNLVRMTDQHTARFPLVKKLQLAKLANRRALNRIARTAVQLKSTKSDNQKTKLIAALRTFKANEKSTKARELSAHLLLSQAKMQEKMSDREHDVDLKEQQEQTRRQVDAAKVALIETRMIAAKAALKDAATKKQNAKHTLVTLTEQLNHSKDEHMKRVLRKQIRKVADKIQSAVVKMRLSQQSLMAGKLEVQVKREDAAERKGLRATKQQFTQIRHSKRALSAQLSTLRFQMQRGQVPHKVLDSVKVLEAKMALEDAKHRVATNKHHLLKMSMAQTKLKKTLLSVGKKTRRWAFVDQAQRRDKRASAALRLAKRFAQERHHKVVSLSESLGKLRHPLGRTNLRRMQKRAELMRQAARQTRKKTRQASQKALRSERGTIQQKLNAEEKKQRQGALQDQRRTRVAVKTLKLRLKSSQKMEKSRVTAAKKKAKLGVKALLRLKKRLTKATTKAAQTQLRQEIATMATSVKLAHEEVHVAKMDSRRVQRQLSQAARAAKVASSKAKAMLQRKSRADHRREKRLAAAKKIRSSLHAARDAYAVAKKAKRVLHTKLRGARGQRKIKLEALLKKAKSHVTSAHNKMLGVRRQQKQAHDLERGRLQQARINMSTERLNRARAKVLKTKVTISKLQGKLRKAKQGTRAANSKTRALVKTRGHEKVKALRKQAQPTLKDSKAGVAKKRIKDQQQAAAEQNEKERRILTTLKAERVALHDQRATMRAASDSLRRTKAAVKREVQSRKDAVVKSNEAKEKERLARRQEAATNKELRHLRHPKGEKSLQRKLASRQRTFNAAQAEVAKVEQNAAKAAEVEREVQKQKERLHFKWRVAQAHLARAKNAVRDLRDKLAKDTTSPARVATRVALRVAQRKLRKLERKTQGLSSSIRHAKVESKLEREERRGLELEVRTFANEKVLRRKQIEQIHERLKATPAGRPAQRSALRKELSRARDQTTIADDKLSSAKAQLHTADERLQKRLAYRGIKWRADQLARAQKRHKHAANALSVMRLRTQASRENVNKSSRYVSMIVGKKQSALAAATAALDAIRGLTGMGKSRTKLRLQIQSLKAEVKERLLKMKDLRDKKAGLDQRVRLLSKKERNANNREQNASKEYRRAKVLGQADNVRATKIQNQIEFANFKARILRAKVKFSQRAQDLAQLKVRIASEQDNTKKARLMEKVSPLRANVLELKANVNDLNAVSKYKQKLISCQSMHRASLGHVRRLLVKSRKLQRQIRLARTKMKDSPVAGKLRKSARKAAAAAAGRTAKLKVQLNLAKRSKKPVAAITRKLALARKELSADQLRAAAAALAEKAARKGTIQKKIKLLKRRRSVALRQLAAHRATALKNSKCVEVQHALISKVQQRYLRARLARKASEHGNEFDARHHGAATQLHRIEQAAYKAQFQEEALKKKHLRYEAALAELMGKLTHVASSMERKTVQRLILTMKGKAESAQAAWAIATQQRKNSQLEQRKAVSQIAGRLARPQMAVPSVPKPKSTGGANPAPAQHQVSAVRAAINNILAQPGK